jgi:hypothetical protein
MSDVAQIIHREQAIDLVSKTAVAGVFIGIVFTLYSNCVHLMIKDFRKGDRPRQTAISFVYSSLITLCAGVSFGANAWVDILAYIDHNDTLGAPLAYFSTLHWSNWALYILISSGILPLTVDVLITAMEVIFSVDQNPIMLTSPSSYGVYGLSGRPPPLQL